MSSKQLKPMYCNKCGIQMTQERGYVIKYIVDPGAVLHPGGAIFCVNCVNEDTKKKTLAEFLGDN